MCRLWRFEVVAEREARFVAAYAGRRLGAAVRDRPRLHPHRAVARRGRHLPDRRSLGNRSQAFERFQAEPGEALSRGSTPSLEGMAGIESFLGAFDLVD